MTNSEFYRVIDREITEIISRNAADVFLKKHKASIANQKAYAFLIWFLEFYFKQPDYLPFLTEGDGDASCDIIFNKYDNTGKKIFFIIQSKWNSESNCESEIESKDIKYTLNDFETILRGGKKNSPNQKLISKLAELRKHVEENGEVRFMFISLCNKNDKIEENILSFLKANKKTSFNVFDIGKIKRDYISVKYKEIEPISPIETYDNPENNKIVVEIERLNLVDGNYIELKKPFEANMFLVKPKTIYELFEKYGFSLFYKNVRNPLIKSNFNQEIEKTIADNPAFFWYYNNGITGITNVLPEIRKEAKYIELKGLQIINGAQTVYSIYSAYLIANQSQRDIIDREALISLRLLKSGGKDFDLRVTRFTNSQNPVSDRDFYANDDIQIRLQLDSFNTKVWYEKRKDEFRSLPTGIIKINNNFFALAYLAHYLQEPTLAINSFKFQNENKKNVLFISHKDNPEGLYEKIFNAKTVYEDMLCSFYLFDLIVDYLCDGELSSVASNNALHNITIFKDFFPRFLRLKNISGVNLSKYIIRKYESGDIEDIIAIMAHINSMTYKYLRRDTLKYESNYHKFLRTKSTFEQIKEKLDKSKISMEILKEDFSLSKRLIKRRKKELEDMKKRKQENLSIKSSESK